MRFLRTALFACLAFWYGTHASAQVAPRGQVAYETAVAATPFALGAYNITPSIRVEEGMDSWLTHDATEYRSFEVRLRAAPRGTDRLEFFASYIKEHATDEDEASTDHVRDRFPRRKAMLGWRLRF